MLRLEPLVYRTVPTPKPREVWVCARMASSRCGTGSKRSTETTRGARRLPCPSSICWLAPGYGRWTPDAPGLVGFCDGDAGTAGVAGFAGTAGVAGPLPWDGVAGEAPVDGIAGIAGVTGP